MDKHELAVAIDMMRGAIEVAANAAIDKFREDTGIVPSSVHFKMVDVSTVNKPDRVLGRVTFDFDDI